MSQTGKTTPPVTDAAEAFIQKIEAWRQVQREAFATTTDATERNRRRHHRAFGAYLYFKYPAIVEWVRTHDRHSPPFDTTRHLKDWQAMIEKFAIAYQQETILDIDDLAHTLCEALDHFRALRQGRLPPIPDRLLASSAM